MKRVIGAVLVEPGARLVHGLAVLDAVDDNGHAYTFSVVYSSSKYGFHVRNIYILGATMNRSEIVRLFKEAAKTYLKKLPKRYIGNQYPISEKALQREFAIALFNENIPFKSEKRYSNSSKRLDFKIFDDDDTAIEIERYSALTDGFAKHTFMDLHKMEGLLNKDEWGMFLAINVCNKYEKVFAEKKSNDPTSFASRKTALHRKWKTSQHYDLIRMNPNYWLWPIKLRNKKGKVEIFTVTILSCYGRYKGGGRWSRT